ncbi:MAG: manganese efflux pump [Bacilli bacterium]|nr:manganese efflux pump [Bacilli bacterium]
MLYVTYFAIALALSVDAFAAFLSFACLEEKKKSFYFIAPLSIGLLHIAFPILSFYIIKSLSIELDLLGKIFSTIIFFVLALMAFFKKKECINKPIIKILSLILLAVGVSVDSFLVGISLSFTTNNIFIPSIIFGITSASITLIAILIGKKIVKKIHFNLDYIAGIVFIVLGITNLF